jgi:curved DNA-binding protein
MGEALSVLGRLESAPRRGVESERQLQSPSRDPTCRRPDAADASSGVPKPMPEHDYYERLGVARSASSDQIKKAYRTLARKYHPDVNPGDKKAEARFKEIQAAYDVLSDKEKRSLYDRFGTAAFEGMGAPGPGARAGEWGFRQAGPAGEVFDFGEFLGPGGFTHADTEGGLEGGGIFELLGRLRGARTGRRPSGSKQGRNIEATLTIPFQTAVQGGETTIEIERKAGHRETLVVRIPPGTEPGVRLRLRGQGEPGEGGSPAGNLTVTVAVEPHPYFTREGRDLFLDLPVTVSEAVLGAKIDVPTLGGMKTLTIPPGSSSGQKLRVRGQGVPSSGGKAAGDLFVVLKIVVPKSVDERGRSLIREFDERNPMNPRKGLW